MLGVPATVGGWLSGAEQKAVFPPLSPVQLQLHGPEPVTAVAVPAVQKLSVGADIALWPFALPQRPFTGAGLKVAITLLAAFMVAMHWLAFTESQPLQAAKTESAAAVGVNLTIAPLETKALPLPEKERVAGIPVVAPLIEPFPVPAKVTVSSESAVNDKVAVAEVELPAASAAVTVMLLFPTTMPDMAQFQVVCVGQETGPTVAVVSTVTEIVEPAPTEPVIVWKLTHLPQL